MSWREALNNTSDQLPRHPQAEDMALLQAGAEADLREAFIPQVNAQTVLWNSTLNFLGKFGRLTYPAPNYDLASFSTGWMALQQPEVDAYGNTLPLPCIEISSHEQDLIRGYFEANSRGLRGKWRTVIPDTPEKQVAERTKKLHETYAASEAAKQEPYIDIEAAIVTFGGVREPRVAHNTKPIAGAYVPGVWTKNEELEIFPHTPLPNSKTYQRHWTRMTPPRQPEISLVPFYHQVQSAAEYRKSLSAHCDEYLKKRGVDIATVGEFVDILQTAEQVGVSALELFERINNQP